MLTERQIEWAKSHDWFCEAYDGFISAWEISVERWTHRVKRKLVYFHDYAELRAWAGY